MSARSQLTKDLNESVKSLLGKHVKILLKTVVKLEIKADKTENRVLVFSPCRFFILTAKVPTRIDTHCHYLEIQAIESKKLNQLSLVVNEKVYTFLTSEELGSQEVDAMIQALYTTIHNIFPTVSLSYIIRRIDVLPESRVQYLEEQERYTCDIRGIGPCGGFSTQYACMCDYHTLPYRDEVAWDVDTIYLSHDTRELCLRDFDHLDPKDLVPIISALEYNTWFSRLRTSNVKLNHEAIERLLHVMKKSVSLEELYLDSLGLKWDFAHKLSMALIANGNTLLHTLDLSNNLIEDKGASSLCGFIAKVNQGATHIKSSISTVSKGLIHLNLSRCGITSKGINHIAHALSVNKCMPSTLTYLNISENNLKDDVTNLCNFLAQFNVISYLDISKTDCSLEAIFGALMKGCCSNLMHLNVSHNTFNIKKTKELPPSFKQFFTSAVALKYINMSYCKLPLDALKNLLLGLACNENVSEVTLDISCNNLGLQGAHVLESCIHGVRSISTLDITENNMDVEFASVITAISKNKSIKHLHMGRNIVNIKTKHIATLVEALVQMIQEEDCVLQTLSIPDCKLKSDLYNLINALGGNQCLVTLDISGNFIGDPGARLLGKALQINSHLKNIFYDKNNITLQGYSDLAYALESNYTLKYMPVPIYDIVPCMKISTEKTEAVMKKIQDILHRNVSPKRYSNGHAFRLQQGFLLSSTQQMIDKLISQIQETLKNNSQDSNQNKNDFDYASKIIQDANNSKHLLSNLHDVILKSEHNGNLVDEKLRKMSEELHSVVINYLQNMMETIIKSAEEACPTVFESDKFQNEIKSIARMKNYLESEFIYSCIVEQAGTQIINKINDLNLAVAAHVSDKITDRVIESLSKFSLTLIDDGCRKRSSTPDVLRSMSRLSTEISHLNHSDISYSSQFNNDRSPIATPHLTSKRKSLHGRKLRPKSVVDSVEGISADDIPDLLPSLQSSTEESLDSVSELPKSVNIQLQHLAKSRPKRAKTRAPSRSHIRSQDETDDSSALDTFFRPESVASSATTPLISPLSDDSISSILTDVTPQMSPVNADSDKKSENSVDFKSNHNSLPKKSYLQYVDENVSSRSRSSDNLSKFMPNNVSPLARRIVNFQSHHNDKNSNNDIDKSIRNNKIGFDRINESYQEDEANKSCMNVDLIQNTPKVYSKSPVFQKESKDSIDNQNSKPRRWSMVDNANKLENENDAMVNKTLVVSATVPGHDPIQEPDYPLEKKSVRELAASLIKQSKESPDNQRKTETGYNFIRPRNNLMPTPFMQKSPNKNISCNDKKVSDVGIKENNN